MIYFTGDIHDNHTNICKFTKRPWTTEQNSEECIKLINQRVKEGDLLYILGDFSFAGTSKFNQVLELVKQIKCSVEFILGNHDKKLVYDTMAHLLPNKVKGVHYYKEIFYGKKMIVLCHYPIFSWNKMQHGSWHLHGHTHGAIDLHGKSLDVGLDGIYEVFGEHKIISIDEVSKYMKTREIANDGGHH